MFSSYVKPHLRLSDTNWNVFRNLLELSRSHHLLSLDLCFLICKMRGQTITIWRWIKFLEQPEVSLNQVLKINLENKVSDQDWLGMYIYIEDSGTNTGFCFSFDLFFFLSSFWHLFSGYKHVLSLHYDWLLSHLHISFISDYWFCCVTFGKFFNPLQPRSIFIYKMGITIFILNGYVIFS